MAKSYCHLQALHFSWAAASVPWEFVGNQSFSNSITVSLSGVAVGFGGPLNSGWLVVGSSGTTWLFSYCSYTIVLRFWNIKYKMMAFITNRPPIIIDGISTSLTISSSLFSITILSICLTKIQLPVSLFLVTTIPFSCFCF